MPNTNDVAFTMIAQEHLRVETLVVRNRDSLDFHEVSVWGIRDALQAAYDLGKTVGAAQRVQRRKRG